jgi:hypothetical protein
MSLDLPGKPPLFPKTAFEQYKPLIKAGSGTGGTVYLCMKRSVDGTKPSLTNVVTAVKTFKVPPKGASVLQKIKEENAKSPCRNLVALFDLTYLDAQPPRQHWYSMHAIKGCTLQRFLREYDGNAPLAMYYHVLKGYASAIKWFDSYDLYFHDITEENVMLEVDKGDRLPRVVLVDLDHSSIS